MKRTVFTLIAVGTLVLISSGIASASDRTNAPSHGELSHRAADRQQTYQTARSLGLSHSQDDRLQKNLRHQARDDQREHRSSTRGVPTYRYQAPSHRSTRWNRNYQTPNNRHSRRNFGYSASGYGHSRSNYGGNRLSISTRGFSLQLGH